MLCLSVFWNHGGSPSFDSMLQRLRPRFRRRAFGVCSNSHVSFDILAPRRQPERYFDATRQHQGTMPGNLEDHLLTICMATDRLCLPLQFAPSPERRVEAVFEKRIGIHSRGPEFLVGGLVYILVRWDARVQILLFEFHFVAPSVSGLHSTQWNIDGHAIASHQGKDVWIARLLVCLGG
jgi:hypothetical protein